MPMGTCYKREGTHAYFYSRKGAWKYPLEIRGLDPMDVVPGYRYELAQDFKTITKRMDLNQYFQKDIQEHGLQVAAGAPSSPSAGSSGAAYASAPAISLQSLMASATGFAKSAIENGMDVEKAARAGIAWAHAWSDDVPPRALALIDVVNTAPKVEPPTPEPEAGPTDEEIPF